MMSNMPHIPGTAGQKLARGVGRLLRMMDHAVLTEFTPIRGLRVDVISLTPDGKIWIVECKSSRADFSCDRKWQGYLEWCDRYFWAVDNAFPQELLPEEHGLMLADAHGAEILRMSLESRLAGSRRNKITRGFARAAAIRLQASLDPQAFSGAVF